MHGIVLRHLYRLQSDLSDEFGIHLALHIVITKKDFPHGGMCVDQKGRTHALPLPSLLGLLGGFSLSLCWAILSEGLGSWPINFGQS